MPCAISRTSSVAAFNSCTVSESTALISCCAGGSRRSALRNRSAMETRRCWTPSCRFRSIRRRASLPATTMRAREAASSARLEALAIAIASSSVNSAIRSSVSSGSGPSRELATIAPQRVPATTTGLPTAAGGSPRHQTSALLDPKRFRQSRPRERSAPCATPPLSRDLARSARANRAGHRHSFRRARSRYRRVRSE